MTAEQIVRALAAADPIASNGCALCGAVAPATEGHEADCPWPPAVAWVNARDAQRLSFWEGRCCEPTPHGMCYREQGHEGTHWGRFADALAP